MLCSCACDYEPRGFYRRLDISCLHEQLLGFQYPFQGFLIFESDFISAPGMLSLSLSSRTQSYNLAMGTVLR